MSGKSKVLYHGMLLSFIRMGQNEQFKLLDKNLIKKSNNWQALLHHAVFYDNKMIAQYLIDIGIDVDALDSDSKTALMIAVEVRNAAVVKVLLAAKANIGFTNATGASALQMVFDPDYCNFEILALVLQQLRRDSFTAESLVNRLFDAGCSMYHAIFLGDIQVMEALIERGIDINSRGYCNKSVLHAAIEMSDVNLAKWALDKGAEVDALDEFDKSALFDAVCHGKVDLVRLLLERKANPNTRQTHGEYTSLFAAFAFSLNQSDQENFDECVELLLEHGAIPENSSVDNNTIFDYALLNHDSNNKIDYLLGQLAILHKLGKSNAKSVMFCNVNDHHLILSQLENIYESCIKLLEFIVHGKLSLFDLLTQNNNKMRIHMRNKTLISKIDSISSMLSETYPYYYRMLRKRILKGAERVALEDEAISSFSKRIFDRNYNLCYVVARQIVGYLSDKDLDRLCYI